MGPTGVGKSALAMEVAGDTKSAIANADSLQCYKGLLVGTAAPTKTMQQKVPHYLYAFVEPGATLSAGQFLHKATACSRAAPEPLMFVGGSGFYARAIQSGMYPAPPVSAARRQFYEQFAHKAGALHAMLHERDSAAAQSIHPNDSYRLIRALSAMDQMGQKWSDVARSPLKPGLELKATCVLWGEVEFLRKQIRKRTQYMLEHGLIEEVEELVQKGLRHWPPMQSVGYKEVLMFLDGKIKKPQLQGAILARSMSLVKKQTKWLKGQKQPQWRFFEAPCDLKHCAAFLKSCLTLKTPLKTLKQNPLCRF